MLIPFATALLVQAAAPLPADIAWRALRAVETDSVEAVSAEWTERRADAPGDRSARLGLGYLAIHTYRYDEAEAHLAALIAGKAEPDAVGRQALLGLAQVLRVQARFVEADAASERAAEVARRAGDVTVEPQALVNVALARLRTTGRPADAVPLFDRATEVAALAGPRVQGLVLCTRALTGLSGSDAVADAETGAELARSAGDGRLESICDFAVVNDIWRRGLSSPWVPIVERLTDRQRRLGDHFGRAGVLQRWAWYSNALGAYGASWRRVHEAIAEAEVSGNVSVLGWASAQLGNLALSLDDLATALSSVERAQDAFEGQSDNIGLMEVDAIRHRLALSVADPVTLERLYGERLDALRESGTTRGSGGYFRAAELASALGRVEDARVWLDSTRAIEASAGRTGWAAGVLLEELDLAIDHGDLAAAEALLPSIVDLPLTPIRRHGVQARKAQVAALSGRLAEAEGTLREAGDSLDAWRARLPEDQLRTWMFQLNDAHEGVATVVARLAEGGLVSEAWSIAERRRARSLLDRLMRASLLMESGAVPMARGDPLVGLLPSVPRGTALLQFHTGRGGEPTTLFVFSEASVDALILPAIDSLDAPIRRLLTLTEAGLDAADIERTLAEVLLDDAISRLGDDVASLIVIPDDALHRIPFDALRMADGRYVIERFAVSYAPSAAVLARLRDLGPSAGEGILALADPRFPGPADRVDGSGGGVYRAAFDASGGLPRLEASGIEGRAVVRYSDDGELRVRERASESFLKSTSLDRYRVVHLATHAVVDERSVTRTALALAPGDGEDGFLGPAELASLDLDADLVVLSACRTSSGVVVRGEGIQGLTAPLLEAGARSVIATARRIGDRAAERLVGDLYEALAEGSTVSEALRDAKLAALRRGAPVHEWAAFTLVGDPSVTVPLRTPRRPWGVWLLLVAAGLALALAAHPGRRGRAGSV